MSFWNNLCKGLDFVFYFRPKEWFGWDFFKSTTSKTYEFIKETYEIKKSTREETYAQALFRHQLTEQEAQNIKDRYYAFSVFFAVIGLGILAYGFYGLINHLWMQAIGAISLSTYVFAMAFRYHFWFFQIEKKQLGLSFSEWFNFFKSRNFT